MSKEHAAKLTTEIKSDMTIEERFDYQVEHTSELTPEQLEKLRNNRHVNRLFETEGRHRNLQGKYETWPLPGKTNDDRWLCLKACFDNDRPDLNWLIGSTSGIHGSYTTLNDLENPESEISPRHESRRRNIRTSNRKSRSLYHPHHPTPCLPHHLWHNRYPV